MKADNLTYAGRPDFGSGCSCPPGHPQAAAQVGARPAQAFCPRLFPRGLIHATISSPIAQEFSAPGEDPTLIEKIAE